MGVPLRARAHANINSLEVNTRELSIESRRHRRNTRAQCVCAFSKKKVNFLEVVFDVCSVYFAVRQFCASVFGEECSCFSEGELVQNFYYNVEGFHSFHPYEFLILGRGVL